MKVKLLKDWGNHKVDTVLELKDKAVIEKGLKEKVFKEVSKTDK